MLVVFVEDDHGDDEDDKDHCVLAACCYGFSFRFSLN